MRKRLIAQKKWGFPVFITFYNFLYNNSKLNIKNNMIFKPILLLILADEVDEVDDFPGFSLF